jgi:hypothetical protein
MAEKHRGELERFSRSLDGEVDFVTQTYQGLFTHLWRARAEHTEYADYLADRYFRSLE